MRIGNEAALFLKLAGEEVDTEISVLAGLGRSADADNLARTALKKDDVANPDEVAGNGDSIGFRGAATTLNEADALASAFTDTGWA